MRVDCDESNSKHWQGGTPRIILKQKAPFEAFWCILINYKKNSWRPKKKRKSVKKLKTLMPDYVNLRWMEMDREQSPNTSNISTTSDWSCFPEVVLVLSMNHTNTMNLLVEREKETYLQIRRIISRVQNRISHANNNNTPIGRYKEGSKHLG